MADEKPFHLQGNFAPVRDEVTADDLPVAGALPPELCGLYVRNGANPATGTSPHWFFGNGMLHGVRLEGGRALWYRNRYVRTPYLENPDAQRISPEGKFDRTVSAANTHVLAHAGRILALEEGSFPFEVDGELRHARPLRFRRPPPDRADRAPEAVPGDRRALRLRLQPGPALPHLSPLQRGRRAGAQRGDRGRRPHHDPRLRHHRDARDLHGSAGGLRSPARAEGHHAVPLERRATRRASASCRATAGAARCAGSRSSLVTSSTASTPTTRARPSSSTCAASTSCGAIPAQIIGPGKQTLHRWTFDLAGGAVKEETLDERGMDFPRVADARTGRKHRYGFTVEFGAGRTARRPDGALEARSRERPLREPPLRRGPQPGRGGLRAGRRRGPELGRGLRALLRARRGQREDGAGGARCFALRSEAAGARAAAAARAVRLPRELDPGRRLIRSRPRVRHEPFRVLPRVTPQNEHFWRGGERGELRFLRCQRVPHLRAPARARVPDVLRARQLAPEAVSGRAHRR